MSSRNAIRKGRRRDIMRTLPQTHSAFVNVKARMEGEEPGLISTSWQGVNEELRARTKDRKKWVNFTTGGDYR